MPEFDYQDVEAWNTALKLTTAVGRLKIGSNLKASADAQEHAFEQAGLACALIAEGAGREGGAQTGLYRDARGAIAQTRAWLHVLASLTNQQESVFGNEFDLAEQCSRQLGALVRTIERGPGPGAAGPRPPMRGGPPASGPRPPGPPRGGLR